MKKRVAYTVDVQRTMLGRNAVTITHYEERLIPPVGHSWVDYGFTLLEGQFINDNQWDLAAEVEKCLKHRNTSA